MNKKMGNKNDSDIIFDRDTSEPKNKMKNNLTHNIKSKDILLDNQNKNYKIKQPKNIQKNQETEEEEEEEEESEEDKEDKVVNNIQKDNNIDKNHKNSISNGINNEENKESEKAEIVIQLKKNEINNSLNDINKQNSLNSQKVSSSCQVNIINSEENKKIIQELKIQVNNLIKEKEQILLKANEDKKNYEDQLEQKKQEISSLSILNAKLKKNLERVSNQVNKLLDKIVENKSLTKSGSSNNITTRNIFLESKNNKKNRIISSALTKNKLNDNLTQNKTNELYSNEEDKNKNNEIESLKEQLVIKNSQLKNSLNLIEFLSKDNKKLKLQYDSFGSDINNINNYKLIEELKKKNKEIRQLEKEYKEVALLKTSDKELDYYKGQIIQLKEINSLNESKIKKMKSVIERYQDLNKNNIINIKYKLNNSNDTKNCQRKINDLSNKDRKNLSMINSYDWRNPEINKNFNKLFNDNEKRALRTLFENEEDFQKFNQKLNTIEKHYSASEKRLQSNIKELKQSIADKDEQISYLRDKIRENEMKIKILLNQVHLERQKTTKK